MVIRVCLSLVVACVMSLRGEDPACAQVIDAPQTAIGPIAGVTQQGAASGYGAPLGSSWGFANTTPRLQFGGTSGSLIDPYASGPTFSQPGIYPTNPSGAFGSPSGGVLGSSSPGPIFGGQAPSIFGQGGLLGSPTLVPSTSGGGGFGSAIYPQSAIPSGSPSTLFPGGLFRGGIFSGGGGPAATAFRFLQGPRVRHTYIYGGQGPYDLGINDTDVSVAFAFPNFFGSTRPLFVVPSFSLHLWDGPEGSTGSDLPANAYSGFLDFGWQSDPNQMFGVELGVRVGAFTEFDTFRGDSLRVLGKGLGSFRLTPFTTFKLGVYYLDRNKVKVLPAGGLLWQPNAFTRFDIFFPQPKFARYWRTVGTRDVWWYATGDYGGGSWTIERDDGTDDSIDINDIRVMLGLEWGLTNLIRTGRRSGFAEIGYVFDREVEYRRSPEDNFKPDDGILFRLGIGY